MSQEEKRNREYFTVKEQFEIARWLGLDPEADLERAQRQILPRSLEVMIGQRPIVMERTGDFTQDQATWMHRRRTIRDFIHAITAPRLPE